MWKIEQQITVSLFHFRDIEESVSCPLISFLPWLSTQSTFSSVMPHISCSVLRSSYKFSLKCTWKRYIILISKPSAWNYEALDSNFCCNNIFFFYIIFFILYFSIDNSFEINCFIQKKQLLFMQTICPWKFIIKKKNLHHIFLAKGVLLTYLFIR